MRACAWIIVAVLVGGCGRGVLGPTADRGEFEPYFQKFEEVSTSLGRSTRGDSMIRIEFGKVQSNEGAACEESFIGGRKVLVDATHWSRLPEDGREVLIFHELGHCLLNRDHANDVIAFADAAGGRLGTRPVSLMFASGVSGSLYSAFKEHYQRELFRK